MKDIIGHLVIGNKGKLIAFMGEEEDFDGQQVLVARSFTNEEAKKTRDKIIKVRISPIK